MQGQSRAGGKAGKAIKRCSREGCEGFEGAMAVTKYGLAGGKAIVEGGKATGRCSA